MKPVNPIQIPLHRAPFYFAPEFIPTRDRWVEIFSSLLATACEKAGRTVNVVAGNGYQVSVDIGGLRLTINADDGCFDAAEVTGEDENGFSIPPDFSVSNIPAAFIDQLHSETVPDRLRNDRKAVSEISGSLVRTMLLRLDAAIKNGFAQYFCRKTEIGDLVPLDAEQFALFVVDDRHRDTFSEPDVLDTASSRFSDTKLYCVCVIPCAPVEAPAASGKPESRGAPGRPETVNHSVLDEIILTLLQSPKGLPDRKKPGWTRAKFTDAVRQQMVVRGETVGRSTVAKKISPLIQKLKKARSEKNFHKSTIAGIH